MKKKLAQEEKELLNSFEKGEWKSLKLSEASIKKYSTYASKTLVKDRRASCISSLREV